MITGLMGTISTAMVCTITESTMYWLTRLDGMKFIPIFLAIPLFLAGIKFWTEGDLPWSNLHKASKYWFIGALLAGITVFIPTTKEMCAIKAIPMIVNNKQVQELPNKVVELANEWIDELKPSKDNK